MSGGGSYGGDGGGPDEGVNCNTLHFRTSLNSPDPAVIFTLKVKDVLTLAQRRADGPLLAIAPSGKVAGSIAGSLLLQLLRCIENGHEYTAVVIKVTGGNVEVEITHA